MSSENLNTPVLSVENVCIDFKTESGLVRAVDNVSFEVQQNEFFGIVGESGSGKSTVCRAIMGLLPKSATVTGRILVYGKDVLTMDELQLRTLRGEQLSMIFQSPSSHLDPLMTVGEQIAQAGRFHRNEDAKTARKIAIERLRDVHFSNPERQVDAYPNQLSGGMMQRALIAAALASESSIMIADEPTTALDVTVQAEILKLLHELREELHDKKGLSIILISHDLGVISQLCDRILVMKSGNAIEQGDSRQILVNPGESYTRQLIESRPENLPKLCNPETSSQTEQPTERVIKVNSVSVDYGHTTNGLLSRLPFFQQPISSKALDDVSLEIHRGDVVGIVGESGSGKSTLARAIMGLVEITEGDILFENQSVQRFSSQQLQLYRRKMQMVFQHPLESLDPHFSVGQSIAEPLLKHRIREGSAVQERVAQLMQLVELPAEFLTRKPHHLSGGQCQRVCIARALAMEPEVLVADEITSALDVTIQAQILTLLAQLQQKMNLTIIFVTHDLSVVKAFCSKVVVIRHGHLIEQGFTENIFNHPQHEYTQQLLAAVPSIDTQTA